jgi:hypothetical protein
MNSTAILEIVKYNRLVRKPKNHPLSPYGGGLGWGLNTKHATALTLTLSQRERG